MLRHLLLVAFAATVQANGKARKSNVDESRATVCSVDNSDNLYNYASMDIHKENEVAFTPFKGNVTLVVNVATY